MAYRIIKSNAKKKKEAKRTVGYTPRNVPKATWPDWVRALVPNSEVTSTAEGSETMLP